MRTNIDLQNMLAKSLAEILRQAVDLMSEIDDVVYAKRTESAESALVSGGAIGVHFRHCLEFVQCFLHGIETGTIDYNRRERNHRLETSREYALAQYTRTIEILENLSPFENNLRVKPEDFAPQEDYWCASSIERELESLRSHTIHHYALIGFKLRSFGFDIPAEFGVSPSTLRFWEQEKSAGFF